jgi:hypothetical protein
VAIIAAGHGRSPLKVLLAPLVAAFNALLGTVSGDVGWCFFVVARRLLPASLCRAKHDRLVAGCALGGDAMRLLERARKEVAMSILSRALCMVFGQHTRTIPVSLAAIMWFTA